MRVLVVEDSTPLRSSVMIALQESGFAVDGAEDGTRAAAFLKRFDYDLVVLDWMLPGMDGMELLRALRARRDATPVLIVTAKDAVDDRVRGLTEGADDYLTKPFALEELLARAHALCRRAYGLASGTIRIADLEIDTSARSVQRGGTSIRLTGREYAVLEYLAHRAGQVVSRSEIEEHVYDRLESPLSNVVDAAIYGLRKKLTVVEGQPTLIHTRRGLGYVLEEGPA